MQLILGYNRKWLKHCKGSKVHKFSFFFFFEYIFFEEKSFILAKLNSRKNPLTMLSTMYLSSAKKNNSQPEFAMKKLIFELKKANCSFVCF